MWNQTILTDRYIHCSELWVVALESPSSVKYRIKYCFWILFFPQNYRALKFCEHLTDFSCLCSHFLHDLEKVKIVSKSANGYIFTNTSCRTIGSEIFANNMTKFFKNLSFFHQKRPYIENFVWIDQKYTLRNSWQNFLKPPKKSVLLSLAMRERSRVKHLHFIFSI